MTESFNERSMQPVSKKEKSSLLDEGGLLNQPILVQVNYLNALPAWKDEKEKDDRITRWTEPEGGVETFRLLWDENPVPEGGTEGFRDLCLRALKETDPEQKRALFKEMSQRIGDKLF